MNYVPDIRIRKGNNSRINPDGDFILYWMIAYRRLTWNYSLDRALERAVELDKPLVVLEALDCDYKWASDRFHGFIIEGMKENGREARDKNILYYPYIEPAPDKGIGLVQTMAKHACLVVTDNFPAFFIPEILRKVSGKLPVLIELVDSNGILPMDAAQREYTTAYSFRRFLQKNLPHYLMDYPREAPLKGLRLKKLKILPEKITGKWPCASREFFDNYPDRLKKLPIDHSVKIIEKIGGHSVASRLLNFFIDDKLPSYDERRNHPEEDATSNLSPYLHFGHISAHEIFHGIQQYEKWHPGKLSENTKGQKEGWWDMSKSAEAFLDQLITWREL
ncbi:MAG: hypothetical protein PVG39_12190, partial [Desulfobacteraceae bacterium]